MNSGEAIRVLVIDDQESIHEDFRKIIHSDYEDTTIDAEAAILFDEQPTESEPVEKFEIDSAHQGEEGLAMVQRALRDKRPYPLAFVDVRMPPGWDGVDTIQRIWEVDPEILIVLCTAYSDHTWEDIVARVGRTDHLLILKKPFDNIEVRQLVLALTKRWHLARQAAITQSQLEQRVVERTREVESRSRDLEQATEDLRMTNEQLAAARLAAETANHAKTDFLANMSHEIRTPMTAIVGYAELLRDELLRAELSGAPLEFIDGLLHNAEHLLGLLNDILDMSKIENNQLNIEHLQCSPWEILHRVAEMMRAPARAKGLTLSIEHIGALPESIETDPLRLRQILTNLIGNAIKFTSMGEVHIAVQLIQGTDGPMLSFEVADTGIGISDEIIRRLFDRFTQADNSTSRQYGGSGLGLAISRRLAILLGGDITVQSEVGRGSKFTATVGTGPLQGICLLDNPQCAAHEDMMPKRNGKIASGERLLLAEDSIDNQRIIAMILTKAGFDVSIAENGQIACDKALAALAENRPFDMILMDMQMPVMEGHEATRRLRAAGYTRPIVALTAHATVEDRRKCLDAGCNFYVTKPINRADLLVVTADYVWGEKSADKYIAPAVVCSPCIPDDQGVLPASVKKDRGVSMGQRDDDVEISRR